MYTTRAAASNSYVFYQYDIGKAPGEFIADASSKRFVIPEKDLMNNCTLFQGIILYLSPSQLSRLPGSVKANQLFMDYLKLSSLAIQAHNLPKDASIEEKEGHLFDSKQAFHLLHYLAKENYAPALRTFGTCYLEGSGIEMNLVESLKCYRQAGDQGYAPALNYVGYLTETGKGVTQDYVEAARLYREAADKGLAKAQQTMAYCLWKGIGVPKNIVEALRYSKLAADQGVATSQQFLAYCYSNGDGVPKNMVLAVKYYKLAGKDGGLPESQHNLATIYEYGQGIRPNMEKALKYYRMAAAQGLIRSQQRLGALETRTAAASHVPAATPALLTQSDLDKALKEQAEVFEKKLRIQQEIYNQQMRELTKKFEELKNLFEQKQAEAKHESL